MSENANWIKKHYITPPLKTIDRVFWKEDSGWRSGHRSASFEIETTIWVDQHLPEYRVAIPSSGATIDGNSEALEYSPVEMRFITYVPTGRVVYDNELPKATAVVYEYILESLLGKTDPKHK